jgi:hypothetical protein
VDHISISHSTGKPSYLAKKSIIALSYPERINPLTTLKRDKNIVLEQLVPLLSHSPLISLHQCLCTLMTTLISHTKKGLVPSPSTQPTPIPAPRPRPITNESNAKAENHREYQRNDQRKSRTRQGGVKGPWRRSARHRPPGPATRKVRRQNGRL